MAIAKGVGKLLRYKREVSWGVAPGATGGQALRRVTSTIDLTKAGYQSNEIRADYQTSDFRHGVRSVAGAINGELSPGQYADFFAALLRQDFAVGVTTGAQTTIAASSAAPNFTRSAGSFLTDGFKVGDVIRVSGFTTGGVTNNARNFVIQAMTATGLTGVFLDGTAVATKIAGDSVTIQVQGKKTLVPQTGHTDVSFAIEHFYSDIVQSELFLGCKVSQIALSLPATGMATIATTFMGKDVLTGTTAYYTAPAATLNGGVLAAVNGALSVGGTQIALLTGLTMTITGGLTSEAVVGSNTYPSVNTGRVQVSGQATALFQDATLRDYFVNETEVALSAAFTTGNTATADFISLNLPRIKVNGTQKDDGEKGLVQTLPYQGLLNINGGAGFSSDLTTIAIQDSLA